MDDTLIYKHWISEINDIGCSRINALMERFGSPEKIYKANLKELKETDGIGEVYANAIIKSRNLDEKLREWDKWEKDGVKYIFSDDDKYPESFKAYANMPFRLFYSGKLPDGKAPTISVVGARACSSYGKAVTLTLAERFAGEGWQIISGMATGIDAYAHMGALRAGGYTCAVLGSGIDVCYPIVNRGIYNDIKETGCIISEYEPGEEPKRAYFPYRNRLIAALSDAVIVIEARKKSGSLITADIALEQGKEVYVLPGRITDPLSMGCIGLLNEGATALTDLNDLRECFPIKRKINKAVPLNKHNQKNVNNTNALDTNYLLLYSCLDLSPKSLESLTVESSIPHDEAAVLITRMKLEGKVDEIAHNLYVRTAF